MVVGGAIFFLALILNVPFLREMFQFQEVGIGEILFCALAGILSIVWFEVYKQVSNRMMKKNVR